MIAHPIESGKPYTALALNYWLPQFFSELWDKAKTRVCADGGANRVASYFEGKDFKKPNFVVGDFDSLRQDVKKTFIQSGTEFLKVYDQDYNDLQKSLKQIHQLGITDPVVIFGAFGGRMDHTIAALHAALECTNLRIYFLDDNNFATWIKPEDKGIICPQQWTTKMCGLIPVGHPVRHIKTKGLKWDCDFGLELGKMISSSNEISEGYDRVMIDTSDPILWTNQTKKLRDLPLHI